MQSVGHRIFGIDPGTHDAGWSVVDLDGNLLASGRIHLTDSRIVEDRIKLIALELGELAARYKSTFVYSEAPIVHRSGRTTVALGRLAGAIDLAVHMATGGKLCVNALQPSEIRKAIGVLKRGKPAALARITQLLRQRGLPFAVYSEDEKEAIAVAWAGAAEVRAAENP